VLTLFLRRGASSNCPVSFTSKYCNKYHVSQRRSEISNPPGYNGFLGRSVYRQKRWMETPLGGDAPRLMGHSQRAMKIALCLPLLRAKGQLQVLKVLQKRGRIQIRTHGTIVLFYELSEGFRALAGFVHACFHSDSSVGTLLYETFNSTKRQSSSPRAHKERYPHTSYWYIHHNVSSRLPTWAPLSQKRVTAMYIPHTVIGTR